MLVLLTAPTADPTTSTSLRGWALRLDSRRVEVIVQAAKSIETGELLKKVATPADEAAWLGTAEDGVRDQAGPALRRVGDLAEDLRELVGAEADTYEKLNDVMDVWVDSGVVHHCLSAMRSEIPYPADLYLEGSDQHRGWFHSSLLVACMLYGAPPYKGLLTHGFVVDDIGLFPRPTPLPTNLDGWLETFATPVMQQLPVEERAGARQEVELLLRPVLCDSRGRWTADYVRLNADYHT